MKVIIVQMNSLSLTSEILTARYFIFSIFWSVFGIFGICNTDVGIGIGI